MNETSNESLFKYHSEIEEKFSIVIGRMCVGATRRRETRRKYTGREMSCLDEF